MYNIIIDSCQITSETIAIEQHRWIQKQKGKHDVNQILP